MKTAWKVLMVIGALAGLAAAVALVAVLISSGVPGGGLSLTIDGDTVDLHGIDGAGWLAALLAILVAGAIVAVVVPFALVIGLGIPALLAGLVLAAGLGLAGAVLAILFSPLIGLVLLTVWLLRRQKRRTVVAAPSGSATIQG